MSSTKTISASFTLTVAPADGRDMGRNLLRNAGFRTMESIKDADGVLVFNTYKNATSATLDNSATHGGTRCLTLTGDSVLDFRVPALEDGKTYTLHFLYQHYGKADGGNDSLLQGKVARTIANDSAATWRECTVTFTNSSSSQPLFRFWCRSGTLVVCQPKLEEGDAATAFCLNEEDLRGEDGEDGADALVLACDPDAVVWTQNDDGVYNETTGEVETDATWDARTVTASVRSGGTEVSTQWDFAASYTNVTGKAVEERGTSGSQSFTLTAPVRKDGAWKDGSVLVTATRKADGKTLEKTVAVLLNAAGTWHMSVKADVMEAVSEQREQDMATVTESISSVRQSAQSVAATVSSMSSGRNLWMNGDFLADAPAPVHNAASGSGEYTDTVSFDTVAAGSSVAAPAGFTRYLSFTCKGASKGVYWKNGADGQRRVLPADSSGTAPSQADADYCLSFYVRASVACRMSAGLEGAKCDTVDVGTEWERKAVYVPKGTSLSGWTKAIVFYPTAAVVKADGSYGRVTLTGIQWERGTAASGAPTPYVRCTDEDFSSFRSSLELKASSADLTVVKDGLEAAGVHLDGKSSKIRLSAATTEITGDLDLKGNLVMSGSRWTEDAVSSAFGGASWLGVDLSTVKSATVAPSSRPMLVLLPGLAATTHYTDGGKTRALAAFPAAMSGVQLSIRTAYAATCAQWATFGHSQWAGLDFDTYDLAYKHCAVVCADPTLVATDSNYLSAVRASYAQSNCLIWKGRRARLAALFPGMILRLTGVLEDGHVMWYVDNAADFEPIDKTVRFGDADGDRTRSYTEPSSSSTQSLGEDDGYDASDSIFLGPARMSGAESDSHVMPNFHICNIAEQSLYVDTYQ